MLMMIPPIQSDTFTGKSSCSWSRTAREWYNKHAALEANYGLEEETPTFKTYKSYCRHLLDKKFWGGQSCAVCRECNVELAHNSF